jgi:HTH-type transcriptional regulator, transcriptional repressor of NAD biosynthesis genes
VPRLGVTVGKFYPPHRGHQRLIEFAQSRCDELVVIVGSRPGEDPPADLRIKWLRMMLPDVRFELVDDVYPEQPDVWAEVTIRVLGRAPDVAFAGESYGAAWARAMGCAFELFDRTTDPEACSGTAVRADPFGHWECLEPPVRAHYARRVCAVGAESTGTTTIARDLAAHYHTVWVPEYGREYYEERVQTDDAGPWTTDEFVQIAREQARQEDLGALVADRVLVCDTDPFATEIWHERYVGTPSAEVAAVAAGRKYDLYLLTGTDIPFVQDGYRDGENIREWMHRRFREELEHRGKPYVLLEGDRQTRLSRAIDRVDELLRIKRDRRPPRSL